MSFLRYGAHFERLRVTPAPPAASTSSQAYTASSNSSLSAMALKSAGTIPTMAPAASGAPSRAAVETHSILSVLTASLLTARKLDGSVFALCSNGVATILATTSVALARASAFGDLLFGVGMSSSFGGVGASRSFPSPSVVVFLSCERSGAHFLSACRHAYASCLDAALSANLKKCPTPGGYDEARDDR